jgi:hypothetical protein
MKKKYRSFIKIGEKTNMERLFFEGELYCNSINYFSELENKNKMADEYDGADSILQVKNLKIKLNSKILATAEKAQLYRRDSDLKGNIYCLYGIEDCDFKLTDHFIKLDLDITFINWGDTAVIIYDTKEFLRRVQVAFQLENKKFEISPVIYFDQKTYEGNLTPFHKRKQLFVGQKEVRFWIPNAFNDVVKIYIGNMSDIGFIIPKSKINEIEYDFK